MTVLDAPNPSVTGAMVDPGRACAGDRDRRLWDSDLPMLVVGLVLGIGVCWPLIGGGRTFLLDWVMGPHTPILSDQVFGLNGGLTAGSPSSVLFAALSSIIGGAATWLPILAIFPLATTAMGRLVGGSAWCRIGAGALYAVNPFVFQRLYAGHIALLLGYACLPFVVRSMLRAVDARGMAKLAPVLWMGALTALSPHFAWITGVILLAVVVTQHRRIAALTWAATVGGCFVASLAYIFLPPLATTLPVTAATSGLQSFRTSGDPHVGLFANVAALYGFWRLGPGPTLPKYLFSGWFFFFVAIAVVATVGAIATFRTTGSTVKGRSNRGVHTAKSCRDHPCVDGYSSRIRAVVAVVLVGAALGYLLALGTQGPTGSVYRWMIDHVPFFDVMREPEKFSMLIVLGLAPCFGLGIDRLLATTGTGQRRVGTIVVTGLALVLPLAYTPTIFNGLDGQIASSRLPSSWARAQSITASRRGGLLFFPWHEYLSFPFTDGRTIANPAPTSFTGDVISGTNAQLRGLSDSTDPRSLYIQGILADHGAAGPIGALLAPLGVQYVALAKTADWNSYRWLSAQPSLRLVFDSPSLVLWRNVDFAGIGRRGVQPVRRQSPVAYRVPAGTQPKVTVAVPYQPGWSLDGSDAKPTEQGTLSVEANSRSAGVLRFGPWRLTEIGDLISVGVLSMIVIMLLFDSRRRSRSKRGVPGP